MPRLFLGLPVPSDAARTLAAWAEAELTPLRIVPEANLHVTLLFFGEADEARRDELAALTREVTWEPLRATNEGLAAFGRTAIAVRLTMPTADLERRFADEHAPLGRLAGFLPECERTRRLQPHVTLARRKSALPPGLLKKHPPALELTFDRLVLFESVPVPGGVRYEALAEGTRSV